VNAPRLRVVASRIGIRTAHSRMPFRYGIVTVRAAPIVTLEVTIETEAGARATGYAADFLAYRWFDKRPEMTLWDNVADLLRVIETAVNLYRGESGYRSAFELWLACGAALERAGSAEGLNALTRSFGLSMPERAVLDALGRLLSRPVAKLLAENVPGIDLARLDPELGGVTPTQILPTLPLDRVWLRHTVGLLDPISADDVRAGGRAGDGLPETLAEYLTADSLRYLKVKISGQLSEDLDRLGRIAALLSDRSIPCAVTLDGNEQYRDLGSFGELMGRLRATAALQPFHDSILFIEQPLERSLALMPETAPLLRRLEKPVIIDEADGTLDAFPAAMALGYRGVSHKNCKGVTKSLLNLARARQRNAELAEERFFLSAEDLTTLPVVPLQSDLALVALLGIPHVERNGHHYFFGLDHLTMEEREAALAHHPDLYRPFGRSAMLRIEDGALVLGSLQVPGMGFKPTPDMDAMQAPDAWLAAHGRDADLGS
jgi:L-alanine-DL-glutamate epimerase-like enolase superfamily enzyme